MPFDGAVDRVKLARRAWDQAGISCTGSSAQLDHRLNLHVAVLQLPFVVLLEQHRADQPDDRGLIGEDADDVTRRLTPLLSRSGGLVTGDDRGAHSFGWDRLGSGIWCDHPGREAPGARSTRWWFPWASC
jgi:hypothetical protein